jgi:hypothetical protein
MTDIKISNLPDAPDENIDFESVFPSTLNDGNTYKVTYDQFSLYIKNTGIFGWTYTPNPFLVGRYSLNTPNDNVSITESFFGIYDSGFNGIFDIDCISGETNVYTVPLNPNNVVNVQWVRDNTLTTSGGVNSIAVMSPSAYSGLSPDADTLYVLV